MKKISELGPEAMCFIGTKYKKVNSIDEVKIKSIDNIFRLADLDQKDLTQKALKLCEEAGEVAQAVLSYIKAPVCGYKNKSQEDILEEVSDVIIVALSIARKLEFSKEDIDTVIENKLIKWEKKINGIQ